MIAGTIVIEDTFIQFQNTFDALERTNIITVTVSDGLTGENETYQCPCEAFAAALGMALHPDGEIPQDPPTEKAMPKNPNLRWIP